MRLCEIFKNKYCISLLLVNVYFIVTEKMKYSGIFIESTYLSIKHLIACWFIVFLLIIYVHNKETITATIFLFTILPYSVFGVFGAQYNIFPCIYNMLLFLLVSFSISSVALKCTKRLRYSAVFSLFLHVSLAVITYLILYGKSISSFKRIFFLSPLSRFSVVDICPINCVELLFFFCMMLVLSCHTIKKSKVLVILTVFVAFAFSSGVAGIKKLPAYKYIKEIDIAFSIYDDYALFYGNDINTVCKYRNDKKTAYDFLIKAEMNESPENTLLKKRNDKYFDVHAVVITNEGIKVKREFKNVSMKSVGDELIKLRNCGDTRNNNPVYKTEKVNTFTVDDKMYGMNMLELIECIKKDVQQRHINKVLFHEIKFHEISDGRVLKTICMRIGDDDVNTLGYLALFGVEHTHEETPVKLKKYKVDFNISTDTDFYRIMKDKKFQTVSGTVSSKLLPVSEKTVLSEFFVLDAGNVYLPDPTLENRTVYLQCE